MFGSKKTSAVKPSGNHRDLLVRALENLSEMVIFTDPEHRITYANRAIENILGYNPEEVIGLDSREFFEGVPGNAADLAKKIRDEAVGGVWRGEILARRKDGSLIDVLLTMNQLEDEQGEPAGCVGVTTDITERRQSEKLLRSVIDASPACIFVKDKNGRYLMVNRSDAELYGTTPEEMIGKTDRDYLQVGVMTAEEMESFLEDDQEVIRGQTSKSDIDETLTLPDGTKRCFHTIKVPLTLQGKGECVLGVALDITDRKEAEDALQVSEKRFRLLFESAPGAVFLETLEGEIVDCNQGAADMLGYSKQELIGMNARRIVPPEVAATFKDIVRQELADGVYSGEAFNRRKNGEIFPVAVSVRLIDLAGKKLNFVLVQDITEYRRMEDELLRAQKLESLGILAGGIAHDFNNILSAVVGNLSFLKQRLKDEKETGEALQEAEDAAIQARRLARRLLTFAKGDTPVKTLLNVEQCIRKAAGFALSGSRTRCRFRLPDDLWVVEADESQLAQVIGNLVINADQAMPGGGLLEISAANAIEDGRGGFPLPAGEYVMITVRDSGVGIPASLLPKIFDPYITTKRRGSGLGLAICFSVVKNHGGMITAESEPGKGTVFRVFLPASKEPPPPEKAEGETVSAEGRILLMDDEEIVRKVAGRLLESMGYTVEHADDGAAAIEKYCSARERGEPFDAVILDLTVPGDRGGEQTLSALREIDPGVRAIVTSGYVSDPIMTGYRAHGFRAAIAKPYKLDELSLAVTAALKDR